MMAAINTASSNSSSSSAAAAAAVKSPRHGGGRIDGVGSPRSRRAPAISAWNQIVRGESELIAAVTSSPSAAAAASAFTAVTEPTIAAADSSCSSSPPPSASSSPSLVEETGGGESSEGSGSGPNGGNVGKRSAWNKPSNGGGGAAAEVGPVMGASWPALSESARASSAKSSSESLKGLSDGLPSVPVSQGSATTVSATTSSQKHAHPTSTPNHTGYGRQRSMKRSNSNASSNGAIPQQQAPAGQVAEIALNNPSPKDHTQRGGFGSHSHGGGDHPQQRNSFRNRNGGPHLRGDGPHHHNYGGRRDQDRGGHDWNSHRSFNVRDNHMQQPRVSPRMFRGPTPPPSLTHFIPPHVRPYGTPMGFELGPAVVYVAHPAPFAAPPLSPMFYTAPDPQLPSKIVNQIDYYFSNENLIKDIYLRQNMDDQGWVPIKLIAGFKKVQHLTDNIQLILEAVRMSNVVEVQGDKVRRRNEWMRWIVLPPMLVHPPSSPQTPGRSSHDMLAARVQGIALEEGTPNLSSSSGQGSYQPQLPNGDAVDHSFPGRN